MNPLTWFRDWLFRPWPTLWDRMKAGWTKIPPTAHIVRRPDGSYYYWTHDPAFECQYCSHVTDFTKPDLHDEKLDGG